MQQQSDQRLVFLTEGLEEVLGFVSYEMFVLNTKNRVFKI